MNDNDNNELQASQLGGSGNIVGVTFNDLDGDGVFDSEDQLISGVTVYLDQNNNGIQDPNELFSVSRPDGVYDFLGLVDGEYFVRQIPPIGTVSTRQEPVVVNIVGGTMVREDRIAFGSTIGGPTPPPPPPGLGSISGVKYNDFNRNGFRDPAEPGLPGFTIYLDQNNNGQLDPDELISVSADDGSFSFTGLPLNSTYTIREIQQPGFQQTIPDPIFVSLSPEQPTASDVPFGNATTGPGTGNISGVLFEDLNIDGFRDSNEPGISGDEVFLDGNRNGILDEGEIISVTDEFGFYSFTEVTPGLFNVDVIRELDETRTSPNPVIIFTGTEEEIPSVVVDIGLITPSGTGNVAGVKYLDSNANGILDPDEPGIPNFTIYADLNSNHILDVREPFNITNQNGDYFLANLPATRVTIREAEQQLGFNLTTESRTVDVPDGETLFGVNFGNAEVNDISGIVFLDNNANGSIDLRDVAVSDILGNIGISDGDIGLSNFTVYLDLDENGIFDPDEPFRITNNQGQYSFNTLPPDTYVVRVVPQASFTQTTPDPVIVVTSGEEANFVNIGQTPDTPRLRGDLIGNKFNDFNSNGILDPGEPGLANFTLYLDQNGNNVLDPNEPASISNANGDFSFNNPPIGTYFLREIPQPGFVKTTPDQQITIIQPINTLLGDPPIVLNVGNAAIAPPLPQGPDGPDGPEQPIEPVPEQPIEPAPEQPIEPAPEQPIEPAPEQPIEPAPEQPIEPAPEQPIEPAPEQPIEDGNTGTTDDTLSASQVTGGGTISGVKFSDNNGNDQVEPNEPGLGGFTIYLDLNENNVLDSGEPSTITLSDPPDARGSYRFDGLPPDTYVVKEVQQPGFTQITSDPVITITGAESFDSVNIGNQPTGGTPTPPPGPSPSPTPVVNTDSTGTISGVKFDDRNADGLAGPDEPRLIDVGIFIDLNGNGLPEANEPFTRTDTNGEYRFTLPPGNFRVLEVPPVGFVNTTPTPLVPVVPGQTVVYNFGDTSIFDPNTRISGFIFTDENNNGIRDSINIGEDINNNGVLDPGEDRNNNGFLDSGSEDLNGNGVLDEGEDLNGNGVIDGQVFTEPGIPTAQVFLDIDGDGELDSSEDLNGDGVLNEGEDIDGDGVLDLDEPETFTDPDGRYIFNGVTPGNYTVDVVRQENLFLTSSRPIINVTVGQVPPDPNITPTPINLPFGQSLFDIDLGVNVRSPQEDTVSGIVFADNNGNGLFEPLLGEVGLPGVEVFLDVKGDGQIQGFEPNQVSGPGGTYGLDVSDVDSGQYELLQKIRTGFTQTTPTALVTVGDGLSTVYNFGNKPQTQITGIVFEDFNSNAIQDFSDTNVNGVPDPDEFVERGVSGFRIYVDLNNNGRFDGSEEPNTFTDTNGDYAIVGLLPGTYTLRLIPRDVIAPTDPNDPTAVSQGFISTTPTDITVTVDEFENSNLEIDFGQSPVIPPAAFGNISGIAFIDDNGDGQADPGELPLPNTTIYIDANENGERDDDERFGLTDQFGRYDIPNIAPGTYVVRQEPRPGFTDSNVPSPVVVTLAAGDNADFVNFANNPTNLEPAVLPFVDLGGIVFNDINGNGLIDNIPPGPDGTPGFVETGIPGVTVFLDRNGNLILDNEERTAVTDSLGVYDFTDLPPGTYTVRQVPPPGLFQTNQDPTVTLFAGDDANFVNFGNSTNPQPLPPIAPPPPPPPTTGTGSISGVTFEDLNGNGFLDAGEPGIGGIVIYFDQNNNSVRDADEIFVASDVNGNYGFSNLADASYTVRQDLNPDQAATFVQTVPGPGQPVFISTFGGENVTGVNIGNVRRDDIIVGSSEF